MKNDKPNDTLNQVWEKYKLKEPVVYESFCYGKQREIAVYKKILRKAGRPVLYTLLLGFVFSFMKLLPKFGIQATFVKAAIALVTTASVGTFAVYQGTSAVISVVKSKQEKVKLNQTNIKPDQPQAIVINPVITKPKEKQVTSTLPQKRKKKTLHPDIGIFELESFVPGIKSNKATQRFLALLPKEKYTFKPEGYKNYKDLTHFTELRLSKDKTGYLFHVRVTNMKSGKYKHHESYHFNDLAEFDSILQKAARELINTEL